MVRSPWTVGPWYFAKTGLIFRNKLNSASGQLIIKPVTPTLPEIYFKTYS